MSNPALRFAVLTLAVFALSIPAHAQPPPETTAPPAATAPPPATAPPAASSATPTARDVPGEAEVGASEAPGAEATEQPANNAGGDAAALPPEKSAEADEQTREPEPPVGAPKPEPQHADFESKETQEPAPPDQARGLKQAPGVEREDVFLFFPRAVLFLPNLVMRVVLLPIKGLALANDRYQVVDHTIDLLYNDERTAAIVPMLSQQTGYGFSYGLMAFHKDLFGHDEEGSVKATFGGQYFQAYEVELSGDHFLDSPLWLDAAFAYEREPALLFHGIGDPLPASTGSGLGPSEAAVATRFRQERVLAAAKLGSAVEDSEQVTRLGLSTIYNHRNFGPEERNFSEPSIERVYDTSQLDGFDDSTDIIEIGPTLVYDSRDTAAITSDGWYFDAFGARAFDLGSDVAFWRYGAQLATFIDLYHQSRVLVVRGVLEVATDDEAIPFSELPRMGGPKRLRGYELDRFRDHIAAVGTVEYHYPIHQFVAGELFLDSGRVGQDYGKVFGADHWSDWRFGGGMGLVIHTEDTTLIKLEAAYGDGFTFFFTTDPLKAFDRRFKQ